MRKGEVHVDGRVVVAMDKFRSSASATRLADAIISRDAGDIVFDVVALSDGGEGFRTTFAGEQHTVRVRGPWGQWHDAPLTIVRTHSENVAIIEVAEIIGRSHLRSPSSREALAASSEGVADAILGAANLGVCRVVVGCGGSATSDGGEGCFERLRATRDFNVVLCAATDIDAAYFAALDYAEQKGVAREDLAQVRERLVRLAAHFELITGSDVRDVARTGAAGGLSGALFALGANLVSGFDEVALATSLPARVEGAAAVITGEGRLDFGSLDGKVVSGVCAMTAPHQRVLVICGACDVEAVGELTRRYPWVEVVDLVSRYGEQRAWSETLECVGETAGLFLAERLST